MTGASLQWRDSPSGYGFVTRLLHWSMAVLFVWQFATAILHLVDDNSAVVDTVW